MAYGCEIRLQPYSPSLLVSFPRCLSRNPRWGPTVVCSIPFWSSFACASFLSPSSTRRLAVSSRRLVTSLPCRLALPPRRLVASSLPCLIASTRIRRSLARISLSLPSPSPSPSPPLSPSPPARPWARAGPLRRARPRPRVSAPVAHGAEPGRGSHTTNANHLVFRAGPTAPPAV